MSRADERRDMDMPTRVRLLEGDFDRFEQLFAKFTEELATVRKYMVGVMVSVTTACVLFSINLIIQVGTGGGG